MMQPVMCSGRVLKGLGGGKGDYFIKRLKLGPLGSFLHLTLSKNGWQVDGELLVVVVRGMVGSGGGEGWVYKIWCYDIFLLS